MRAKTLAFVAIVVASNLFGNFALSAGMRGSDLSPLASLVHPLVLIGIALLIVWTLSRMALLSWADLSFVLPVTSIGYVFNALMGKFFLGEQITPQRWAGTLLIMAGTILVGRAAESSRKP